MSDDIDVPCADISVLTKQIFDGIPQINTEHQLVDIISSLKYKSDEAITEFKNILIAFTNILSAVSGIHILKEYNHKIIESIEQYPKNIIDTFIMHGYIKNNGEYRKRIIEADEKFFLNESYNEYTEGRPKSIVDYIFQFKMFWHNLNDENKNIIKNLLLTLCHFADKRYVCYYKYLELKTVNHEKFKKIFEKNDAYM